MLLISQRSGIPFLATIRKSLPEIFSNLNLVKGSKFLELGCGDGIVTCTAVKDYGLIGKGVDINFILIIFAKLKAIKMGISDRTEFIRQDICTTDFAWADVIYLYLLPRYISSDKIKNKFTTEVKPGTIVISHGFPIPYFDKRQIKLIPTKDYETYVYKI